MTPIPHACGESICCRLSLSRPTGSGLIESCLRQRRRLPFSDGSFDFVSQFVLFTSILDQEMKRQMAREIYRVLVPRGRFLWYDFAYNNPRNPDVRGIRLAEVRELFPGFSIASRRITLAPPLGRAIGHLGPTPYYSASQLRFLCTHYLCLLEKK